MIDDNVRHTNIFAFYGIVEKRFVVFNRFGEVGQPRLLRHRLCLPKCDRAIRVKQQVIQFFNVISEQREQRFLSIVFFCQCEKWVDERNAVVDHDHSQTWL